MEYKNIRVAISQPAIILGGCLSVIIGIVKILNKVGIVSDIIIKNYFFTQITNEE